MKKVSGLITLMAALLSQGGPVHAAGTDPVAQTDPIKPASVMGDKDRSGPDGWVQAPVSRTHAPGQTAKAAGETPMPTPPATPPASKPMSAGDDPSAPRPAPAYEPGTTPSH